MLRANFFALSPRGEIPLYGRGQFELGHNIGPKFQRKKGPQDLYRWSSYFIGPMTHIISSQWLILYFIGSMVQWLIPYVIRLMVLFFYGLFHILSDPSGHKISIDNSHILLDRWFISYRANDPFHIWIRLRCCKFFYSTYIILILRVWI